MSQPPADRRSSLGGVIHTYQQYDPAQFPSPTQPPPDMVSGAFEHLLAYGDMRELTEEELARAVRIDPKMLSRLGPSLDLLRAILLERKRKILERYETDRVQADAGQQYREAVDGFDAPKDLRKAFSRAARDEQIRELEQLWYRVGGERSPLGEPLLDVIAALGEKYQVEQLAAKYHFTGRERLTIPEALAVKEELEKIDQLLKQLDEAQKTAQIGVIDMEALAELTEPGDRQELNDLHRAMQEYLRDLAEQQGLEKTKRGYRLTPKAYRLFQRKLLERIFSQLQAGRSGRHGGPILGDGAVELASTKPYEFGDSIAQMDIVTSLTNAMVQRPGERPVRFKSDDIVVHRTRNRPKCATVVLMDMSGSMRYGGLYVNVKRMALALDGLIRREYPGDYLQFIEMATFAKPCAVGDIVALLPKPVTIFDPVVMRRYDMSRDDVSEALIPPHFTNIQHGLQLARRFLASKDTPNRQVILITDGLPTAHFEAEKLYLLYPPHPNTEQATMREGELCRRENITINMFLLPSWSQTSEDVQFAYRLAERTSGRVFFTAGRDLDRYVVWDYVEHRRAIIG
ncbi:MAG: hypothetical protein JSS27_05975 [Planctomycetes bacterium]|nr:hypothetical protein [Planctomycetota bacterium]